MADTGTQTFVKAEDFFQEIRQILKENAESQAESRKEFAESRKEFIESRNELAENRKEFIESRREFIESRKEFIENRKEFIESRKEFIESRNELAESRKEQDRRKEEQDRRKEEHDRDMEEIRKLHKETERIIGKLGNRFGEMVEHLIVPNIKEKFRALNFNFDHVSQNHEISANGHSLAEIDILLENGDLAIAVEVKAKPVQKDVDDHIRRMEILRQKADAKNDRRKYQGAIAGAIMSNEVRDYAHKAGFYVIEQTGDTVRINIPEGFKAREW